MEAHRLASTAVHTTNLMLLHMHMDMHMHMQITDDSEMAMCLLHGLKEAAASGPLPLDAIEHVFIKWLDSPPFDIGGHAQRATCSSRFPTWQPRGCSAPAWRWLGERAARQQNEEKS